jgi:hypothetical protein
MTMIEKRTDLEGLDRYIAMGYAPHVLAKSWDFSEQFITLRKHESGGMKTTGPIAKGNRVKVKPPYQKAFPKITTTGTVTDNLNGILRVKWDNSRYVETISDQYVERVA